MSIARDFEKTGRSHILPSLCILAAIIGGCGSFDLCSKGGSLSVTSRENRLLFRAFRLSLCSPFCLSHSAYSCDVPSPQSGLFLSFLYISRSQLLLLSPYPHADSCSYPCYR